MCCDHDKTEDEYDQDRTNSLAQLEDPGDDADVNRSNSLAGLEDQGFGGGKDNRRNSLA